MPRPTKEFVKNREAWMAELHDFIKQFSGESDRAFVILTAAKIDGLLRQLIQNALLPHPGNTDELLEGDAPLSTFHSRTLMAFRLGLIGADLARAIHLIRRIRNNFAHELSGATLDTGAHRDRVRELIEPFRRAWIIEEISNLSGAGRTSPPASDYAAVCYLVMTRLQKAIGLAKEPTSRPMPLVAASWLDRRRMQRINRKFPKTNAES